MIDFVKYHGAGNDFILIDNRDKKFKGDKITFAKKWCNRRFGIGSDGIIFIEKWSLGDFEMDFYNPDGSQSFCGNGSRCAVAFSKDLGIVDKKAHFLAVDGEHEAEINDGTYSIKMSDISEIKEDGKNLIIDTGSPHYLINCLKTEAVDVLKEGRKVRFSDDFKEKGINVNFIEDVATDQINLRTYERGVENETLACGTGATAAALSFAYRNELNSGTIKVAVLGGDLQVKFEKDGDGFKNVWLIGPAIHVFKGGIDA